MKNFKTLPRGLQAFIIWLAVSPFLLFFVLGDNSASSKDSRYWGFVPQKDLIGRAEFIYWPLMRLRAIK